MDESVIPQGMYCYSQSRNKGRCPYWELREDKPYQLNGYCRFLDRGDWEEENKGFGLLWDQCKECGVNDD